MHIIFYWVRALTRVKIIVFGINDAGCPNRYMHIIIRNVKALTDFRVLDLREDASVTCVYVYKRAKSSKISHDSGAQNGGGLIEFRGKQIAFLSGPGILRKCLKFPRRLTSEFKTTPPALEEPRHSVGFEGRSLLRFSSLSALPRRRHWLVWTPAVDSLIH
jgi:hypothetical protein